MQTPAKPRIHKHTVLNKPRGAGVRMPVLLISGEWVAAAGFSIGAKYTALSEEPGRLVLTVYEPAPVAPPDRRRT